MQIHPLGLVTTLLLSCPLLGQESAEPAATRWALFAHMQEARFEGLPERGAGAGEPARHAYGFEGQLSPAARFGRLDGRSLDWSAEAGAEYGVAGGAGLVGDALALGPELADLSRISLTLPATGLARVVVTGRVRLEGHPDPDNATAREVLRLVEHEGEVADPTTLSRRERWRAQTHRFSRHLDPSGWDHVRAEILTQASTGTLELQLLHQSGGLGSARTLYDELSVEVTPLDDADVLSEIEQHHRPRDGRERDTPWRMRVELDAAGGEGGRSRTRETRDCLLLAPPARVFAPLSVPGAEHEPLLRLYAGMAPESFGAPGDGARLVARFHPADGSAAIELGRVELDHKSNSRQRSWRELSFELAPVAGMSGELELASEDLGEDEEGVRDIDPVLISTPRIEPRAGEPGAFNVLLIGIDTVRADHLSAYGYERPTTPNLAALAAEGVLFSSARSQAPWTLPSFSSILTSLYPSAHGAGRGGHDEWTPIDPGSTSIAEVLARLGWETQGIVANGLISPHYGLDQGFDGYRFAWAMESVERDTPEVMSWIDSHQHTPWLLFWHAMDPHLPYVVDQEFQDAFVDPDYDGQFESRGRMNVPFQVLDPREGRRWYTHEGPPPMPQITPADARYISDAYDAELAELDRAVGQVLDALRASGQWERTIVAFVSDHGEGLGDHDHYHHGYTLFEDQVHIPMLLRIPGEEARTIERPVASIDLAPTILGALGLPQHEEFQGVDRLAPDAPDDDAYFMEYPTYDSSAQKAWVKGRFKYLHDPWFRTEALYDLISDPGERSDVAGAHPEVVLEARAAMDAFRWEQSQTGRYHLRVRGGVGQRLRVRVGTDDLFDANFVARPAPPLADYDLDLDRSRLILDTVLSEGAIELVFWCRGNELSFEVELEGRKLPRGIELGLEDEKLLLPGTITPREVPIERAADLGWPGPGGGLLWLEAGATQVAPVVLSPEEIEILRALGYAR